MLTVLAILPGIVLLGYVYKLDKIEKEPKGLLIKLFILGMAIVVPVAFVEIFLEQFLTMLFYTNTLLYQVIENFLCVALIEEGFKLIALRLGSWNHREFNYRFDGIVYAVCVSMGFAIVENIMYVSQGGLSVAIARALMSIPGHCIFAVYMGYYYGLSKLQDKMHNPYKGLSSLASIVIPVLLHGSYDLMASSNSDVMTIVFLIFVLVIEIISFIKVRQYSKEDMPMPY